MIFDAFAQADGSSTRKYEGTGPRPHVISSRLAEMMGGELWVQSEPGKGSVFHFTTRFERSPAAARAVGAGQGARSRRAHRRRQPHHARHPGRAAARLGAGPDAGRHGGDRQRGGGPRRGRRRAVRPHLDRCRHDRRRRVRIRRTATAAGRARADRDDADHRHAATSARRGASCASPPPSPSLSRRATSRRAVVQALRPTAAHPASADDEARTPAPMQPLAS